MFLPNGEDSGSSSGVIEVLALTREGWDTCASLKDGGRGSPAEKI